jgi:hypothetical protein
MQVIMEGRIVSRYLASAVPDMIRNNRKEIRYPYKRCKQVTLMDPFSGSLKAHLLLHGFMDGFNYTQWIVEDDDDDNDEGVDNNDEEG